MPEPPNSAGWRWRCRPTAWTAASRYC